MKTTTAIKNLYKIAEQRSNKAPFYIKIKQTKGWHLIMDALDNGTNLIRPCRISGVGRYAKNMDYTLAICNLLDAAQIKYRRGNDAPRGGLTGNYIVLTNIEK